MNRPVLDSLPPYTHHHRSLVYAGIGSRETPAQVQAMMTKLAARLAQLGYTLRSGGAEGADKAFEAGAAGKEIFYAQHAASDQVAQSLVDEIHPYPSALKPYPRNLMARNAYQVFGSDLNSPVDFVLVWTPDGVEHHDYRKRTTGGSGQAISLASLKGIPVINLANDNWKDKIKQIIFA